MRYEFSSPAKSPGFEKALTAIVLAYAAFVFCLPVAFSDTISYPWWATKISFGNLLLHEAVFLFWLSVYGFRFVLKKLLNGGIPTRQASVCLIALAVWCGIISLTTPLPLQDLGRSFRLLLISALMMGVVRWTQQAGAFPLLMLLVGLLCGTLVNLIMSFQYPLIVNETMRLSGQNTPGVAMGLAIHLGAWFFYRSGDRLMFQIVAVTTALVCAFGCGISYSRIGWFTGILGLVAWLYILSLARHRSHVERARARRSRLIWVTIFLLVLTASPFSSVVRENVSRIQSLAEQKFSREGDGDEHRKSYFLGVAEIVAKHPLGVGYSGFYDSMTSTDVYRSGRAAREESLDANPHSTFLYYASAGGILGGILSIVLFIFLLRSMRMGMVAAFGFPGRILFALVAIPYLLIGLTVPYLFNSIILIAPAAIAAAWGRSGQIDGRGAKYGAAGIDSAMEPWKPIRSYS